MNMIQYMDENLLVRKGMEILLKELGPTETLRFICLPSQKRETPRICYNQVYKTWMKPGR